MFCIVFRVLNAIFIGAFLKSFVILAVAHKSQQLLWISTYLMIAKYAETYIAVTNYKRIWF
jgi:hypothetical protein